jgi:putative tryptophan/tyrosine transport system substrate-binding protein
MRRREFVKAIVGLASAWPFAVRAQQPAMPVIGWLHSGSAHDPYFAALLASYRLGLKDAGYVEGQNIKIEFRWGEGQYDQIPTLAAELARKAVAVIAAGGPSAAIAAKTATGTIPIVFTVGDDPVKLGLVASFNRPGGNATGVSVALDEIEAKRLGLLREVVPAAKTIAVLLNPRNPSFQTQSNDLQAGARGSGLEVAILTATSTQEIDQAFSALDQMHAAALLVGVDVFLTGFREQIVTLATRHSLPTMFGWRDAVNIGGLMSYTVNLAGMYRQAGDYAGRILKGEKPADLPVLRPTRFELAINLKTAKALGIKISDNLLSLADEVIE